MPFTFIQTLFVMSLKTLYEIDHDARKMEDSIVAREMIYAVSKEIERRADLG